MTDHTRDCRALMSVHEDMLRLRKVLESSSIPADVTARGYCLPDEDMWVKRMFATYLRHRTAVFDIIDRRRDYAAKPFDEVAESFAVGFAAAVLLFRWSSIVVGSFKDNKPIRAKLNESDLGVNGLGDSFDMIHRSLTRVATLESLADAAEFFDLHEMDLRTMLRDDDSTWLLDRIDENLQAIERGTGRSGAADWIAAWPSPSGVPPNRSSSSYIVRKAFFSMPSATCGSTTCHPYPRSTERGLWRSLDPATSSSCAPN